jgi:hypothetical protein
MNVHPEPDLIDLIKWDNFEPYNAKYNFDNFKVSKKKFNHDKKTLDDLKLSIIKNIVILNDLLIQNGFDKNGKLTTFISVLFENCILNNTNEDENYLLIVTIKLHRKQYYSNLRRNTLRLKISTRRF